MVLGRKLPVFYHAVEALVVFIGLLFLWTGFIVRTKLGTQKVLLFGFFVIQRSFIFFNFYVVFFGKKNLLDILKIFECLMKFMDVQGFLLFLVNKKIYLHNEIK